MQENKLRLLISTDNHLGYLEKDSIRGDDSFRAFEEVLKIAKEENVDAIILGGDLFHDNKPSRRCIHRTMELLRHYCMGDGEVAIELLSDSTQNFTSLFGTANWEDPNYNIAIPLFTIHGNHDDPTGDGSLSSLDLLSTAGLLNYFGKTSTVDDITMNPVLLRKGTTKLALYGLGSIRDERLHRTFLQSKVKMMRPPQADKEYFSILLFHQNRAAHSPTNHIPENFLDDFLDLIVWGHEHECLAQEDIEEHESPERGFQVLQLGSSVHTSLSEGESKPKNCMIADIEGRRYSLRRRPLLSVRPFLIRNISLQKLLKTLRPLKEVEELLYKEVEESLSNISKDMPTASTPLLPLLRLRVDYSFDGDCADGIDRHQYPLPNIQRFGLSFQDRLANTKDIILPLRRSSSKATRKVSENHTTTTTTTTTSSKIKMEDLMEDCLMRNRKDGVDPLQLLPVKEFMDVISRSVEKDDRDLISDFVKSSLKEFKESNFNVSLPGGLMRGFVDDVPLDSLIIRSKMSHWKAKKDDEFINGISVKENIPNRKILTTIDADADADGVTDFVCEGDKESDNDDIRMEEIVTTPKEKQAPFKGRRMAIAATKNAAPASKIAKKSWPPSRS